MTDSAVLAAQPARTDESASAKHYIYAIVRSGPFDTRSLEGVGGRQVSAIVEGRVAALVSDMEGVSRIRPERRNLAAHHEVLKSLMASSVVPLPMAFGILADNPGAVQRMLARNQTTLVTQLERVADKVEMGLRVIWDVPNIFAYFVDTHAELRAMRDRIVGKARGVTHEEKIEIGSLFDRQLSEERVRSVETVERCLAPVCSELKVNKCRNEFEVMNLACLIQRDAQDAFSRAVFEAARLFDDRFSFDFSGPWAPHNFVDFNLDL